MILRNPIFKREFSSSSRSWRNNFLIGSYLVLLAGVLLTLWPAGGIQSVVSDSSKQIFSLFFSINLTLIILLVPAFSATSITYEKENNTFAALFSTLLTPLEIVMGKLSASILMLVILVVLSMPIASVCALTGGVSMQLILKIMLVVVVAAISYGLLGLACSAKCQRSTSSVLLNYALILFFAGGTWLPDALLGNILNFFGLRYVWQLIRSISPYDALFYLLDPESYKMSMNVQMNLAFVNPFTVYMISAVAMCLGCFAFFYRKIVQPSTRTASAQGEVYTGTKQAIKRKLTWPFYLFDPLKRKKPIRRFANPVFVAEMRSKLFANPKFVLRGVSGIFVISLVLLTLIAFQFGSSLRADLVRTVAIIFQIGVVAMLAPAVSSGLITEELTTGTFMALRMTPMKPYTVIVGKLKATFFYALIFIVSSFFVLLAMAYLEHQDVWPDEGFWLPSFWSQVFESAKDPAWWTKLWQTYRRIGVWVIILLLSTITFLTGGLFASSVSKTTGIATALGYALTAIICLVSFAPLVMQERLSNELGGIILSVNPIAAAMYITNDAFQEYPDLWVHNVYALVGLTVFFLFGATLRAWYLFRRQE